ncbi:hypothetical protein MAP00_001673 [Monascus purpureus]|nr:hypothetical protein MAP00_001673 [Monascus purpureus]
MKNILSLAALGWQLTAAFQGVEASKLSTAASLKPYFNNKAFGSYPGAAAFDPLNQSYPNPAIVSINGTYTSTQTGIVYKSPGNTAP